MAYLLIKRHGVCTLLADGCYSICAAPRSDVCREARGGACVRHTEENSIDGGRHGAQSSSAQGSTEGVERVRETTCADSTGNCETSACNVQIGDTLYCSQCKTGFVPINGKCAAASSSQDKCTNAAGTGDANTICEKCIGATFMFKGGCYDSTVPPGNVICSEAGSTAGQCETCADGYFKNSNASPTSDSCSECDPTCLTCSATGESGCTACTEGTHFLGVAGNGPGKCVSCGDATGSGGWTGVTGCAKCTKPNTAGAATCTECTTNYYPKTAGSITSCVADCGEGFFATTVGSGKKCARCSIMLMAA